MANDISPEKLNSEGLRRRTPSISMHVVGGNSTPQDAQVVILATKNHYKPEYQGEIRQTLGALSQPGDTVLTEGEPFGRLNSSWVPEMAGVDTSKVTLMGWEIPGLYNKATGIVRELSRDTQLLNFLSGFDLGQLVSPFMETLKQRISTGMALFNEVVWHERSRAMKAAVMNVLGHSLQTGRRLFVYSGAAHSTTSELGGTFDGIRHTVLEV